MPMVVASADEFHYERLGTGKPMVMLMPESRGPNGISHFVDGLAETFSIISNIHKGRSDNTRAETEDLISINGLAGEVISLIDVLGIERTYLCCHSTGCGIGLEIASVRPNLVEALILINPWRHADRHLTSMQQLRIASAKVLSPYQYSKFNTSLLFPPEYRRAYQTGFEQMAKIAGSAPHDAHQIENRLKAILAYDTRKVTAQITSPTLIVTARDDQLMPAWFGKGLATDIANSHLVTLKGGGHMLPETRCIELLNEIFNFLKVSN